MARAQITTKGGAKITIEGTAAEVSVMIDRFERRDVTNVSTPSISKHKSKPKPTLIGLVAELIDGGFFNKPRELGVVRLALEEQGHFYPVTTLSPIMLRLIRRRDLRRIKDNKRWLYVR